ncbi:MAG: hypothetical protein U1E78_05510 [Gammaproteobacteria bacterium]
MPENEEIKDLLREIQIIGVIPRTSDGAGSKIPDWAGSEPSSEFYATVESAHTIDRARQGIEIENRLRWFGKAAPVPFQFIAAPFFSAWDSLKDIYYGRRIKTTLVLNLSVLVGIGAALAIAFVALPLLITALGPAGMVFAGTTIAFGGAVGFAAFGAMFGGVAGKWITQKLFPEERKMQPKKSDSARYESIYKIDEGVYILMNAYLQNRISATTDELGKRLLKNLRKDALKKRHALNHVKLGHYFCEEYNILQASEPRTLNVEKNLKALEVVLKSLSSENAVMDEGTKKKIKKTLEPHQTADHHSVDPALHERLSLLTSEPSSRKVTDPHDNQATQFKPIFKSGIIKPEISTLQSLVANSGIQLQTASETQHIFSTGEKSLLVVNVKENEFMTNLGAFQSLSVDQKKKMAACFICEFKSQAGSGQIMEIVAGGNAEFAQLLYSEAKAQKIKAVIAQDGFKSKREVESIVRRVEEKGQAKTYGNK